MSTTDDEYLVAAIDAKLARIVEVTPTPFAWHDDWMRLGPESTAEERLAVYQAVRDSHCFPAIVGFSLAAWSIETMSNDESRTALRDLDERMRAMEAAYEQQEGERWPDDDVPQEYEALSRQYDEAWNRIFLAKLEACGEPEMADAFRADPEKFETRYDLGLQFFDQRVVIRKPRAADDLVKVASCLDLPRANLVQLVLAQEGIPTALGNANFVNWNWDNSNAVGGVKIYVRNRDAEAARDVLSAARNKPSTSLPPWICGACGQRIAGQWDVCWQCGRLADGTLESPQADATAGQPPNDVGTTGWRLPRVIVASLIFVALVLGRGTRPPLIFVPLVVILICVLGRFDASPCAESDPDATAEPSAPASRNLSTTRSEVSKAIVLRAWQAAVIGGCCFPPLGFYSMRLLWKLAQRDTPLGWADNWRCVAAFCLNIATILFCLTFAGIFLHAFLGFPHGQ